MRCYKRIMNASILAAVSRTILIFSSSVGAGEKQEAPVARSTVESAAKG